MYYSTWRYDYWVLWGIRYKSIYLPHFNDLLKEDWVTLNNYRNIYNKMRVWGIEYYDFMQKL